MITAIKSYIIFALTFFLIDLDFAKEYKDIILRWPSVNIVSAILKIKGFEIFKDGVFVSNTEAQLLDNKTVAVLNSSLDYPIEIRYLWKD